MSPPGSTVVAAIRLWRVAKVWVTLGSSGLAGFGAIAGRCGMTARMRGLVVVLVVGCLAATSAAPATAALRYALRNERKTLVALRDGKEVARAGTADPAPPYPAATYPFDVAGKSNQPKRSANSRVGCGLQSDKSFCQSRSQTRSWRHCSSSACARALGKSVNCSMLDCRCWLKLAR